MNKEHVRVKRRERDADHCKDAVTNPGRRVPESQSPLVKDASEEKRSYAILCRIGRLSKRDQRVHHR
jgi:rhodanese-related sulfurtransferase